MGEHLHLPRLLRRQLAADGGIHADQPLGLRLLQRDPAGGVTGAYHAIRQAGAVEIAADAPPVPFQLRVELLEVALRQLVQRDFIDVRNDVIVDPILIALLRRDPQAGLGPGLIPQVDPLAEGHIRFCSAGDDAALHLEFFQLLLADRLGHGGDAFRDGRALLVVADNDTAFPAPVFSQSERSFSGLSFSCHGFSSFPNSSSMKLPTMTEAFFCMSVVTCV